VYNGILDLDMNEELIHNRLLSRYNIQSYPDGRRPTNVFVCML